MAGENWAPTLDDEHAIAAYIARVSTADVDEQFIAEYFAGRSCVLESVSIAQIVEGDPDHNLPDARKQLRYDAMDPAGMPPIVIEDGRVIDGNHRLRSARRHGLTHISAYVASRGPGPQAGAQAETDAVSFLDTLRMSAAIYGYGEGCGLARSAALALSVHRHLQEIFRMAGGVPTRFHVSAGPAQSVAVEIDGRLADAAGVRPVADGQATVLASPRELLLHLAGAGKVIDPLRDLDGSDYVVRHAQECATRRNRGNGLCDPLAAAARDACMSGARAAAPAKPAH